MKAGGTNVLDIYEELYDCRPEDKPLIICPPAHAGSVSAARAASCALPDVQKGEKYIGGIASYCRRKMDELCSLILIHSLGSW